MNFGFQLNSGVTISTVIGANPQIDKYLNGWSIATTFGSSLDNDYRAKAFLLKK